MYATIESVELQEEANQLAAMILQSEEAEHYRNCFKRLQQDEEAQQIIAHFTKVKSSMRMCSGSASIIRTIERSQRKCVRSKES